MPEETKEKKSSIGSLVVIAILLLIGGIVVVLGLKVWGAVRPRVVPLSILRSERATVDDLICACKVLTEKANKSKLSADQKTDAAAAMIPLLNSQKSVTREEQWSRSYTYRMGGRVIRVPGKTAMITYHVSDSALEALKALSGQDYGKDASVWQSWLSSLGLGIASPLPHLDTNEVKKQEQTFFKDMKNGYFMLAPPKGWLTQEYQDSRTKVSFISPINQQVFLRFIVCEAPGETFELMKEEDEATARTMRDRGISCQVTDTEFMGVPTIEIDSEFPGGEGFSTQRKFVVSGLHFNIQYSAPTRALFEEHLPEALAAIDTLVVRKADTTNSDKVRMQSVDHYLRYAQLTAEIVGVEEALTILKEASQLFPDDIRVTDAIAEMKNLLQGR